MKILRAVWALNQETQSVQIGISSNHNLENITKANLIKINKDNNNIETVDVSNSLEYSSYVNFEQGTYTTYEVLIKAGELSANCLYYIILKAELTNEKNESFSISSTAAVVLTEYLPVITDTKYNILAPGSEINIITDPSTIHINPTVDIAASDGLIGYRYLVRESTTDTKNEGLSEFVYSDKINFSITNKTYGESFNVLVMYYTEKGYYGWFEYNFETISREKSNSVATFLNTVQVIDDYMFFDLTFTNQSDMVLNGQIKIERQEFSQADYQQLFSYNIPLYQTSINFQFKDRGIEAGKRYKYRIYYEWLDSNNNALRSNIVLSNEEWRYITFEDVYLSDADTTVPLRYNVELTNFKYNIADSITPTLGGRYPFVRRNGQQNYRTFTIGGLISYHAEEDDLIMGATHDSLISSVFSSNDKEQYNELSKYEQERLLEKTYREKLFAFLHNGKPKVFKSFQEGTMLVCLSNISLTSNKTLDRNIYSFSAQATEIGDISPKTMQDFSDFSISVPAVLYNEYILDAISYSKETGLVEIAQTSYDSANDAIILKKQSIYFGDKEGA